MTEHDRRRPEVRIARTAEEREAIYRFRYEIYYQENGRLLGRPDHRKRWVRDEQDESPTTSILYIGSPARVEATVRLSHWRPGEVPSYSFDELSMDRIPGIEARATAEIGRLMVRPSRRGKLLVAALVKASYRLLVAQHDTELVFCYCSPGLAHFYRRIAMRPFGGRLIHAPDGIMVPMVSVTSDEAYYREVGSYLAPMVASFFGPGQRSTLDPEALAPAFEDRSLLLDGGAVSREVRRFLRSSEGRWRSPWLATLSSEDRDAMVRSGLTVDVPAGAMVTRRGFREDDLFVVLSGTFSIDESVVDDGPRFGPGDHFGEESLWRQDGRRRFTVRAVSAGRLLILRGRCLRSLLRRCSELAPTVKLTCQSSRGHESAA